LFSSNGDPFQGPSGGKACTCYSKFSAYALLNHNGDFAAAAKDLAAKGYGDPRKKTAGSRGAALPADDVQLFTNFLEEETVRPGGKTVVIRVGLPITTIGQALLRVTDGWPKRTSSSLFVPGPDWQPLWLQSPDSLFAWIGHQLPNADRNLII